MYVRCAQLQVKVYVVRLVLGALPRAVGQQPGCMAAEIGSDHLADDGAIGRRVAGNPLQRVNAAEPHVQLGAAELVDRAGEPLGDLGLTACL
jgi:hypothetical protein